jgi:phosphoribosyl 1,2-cyclic phosphodiesterase
VRVRFWGTRGSIATPGPSTVRYGGNTSCVEVVSSRGTTVVLDCGTGARLLGQSDPRRSGALLVGHTHWDHIQGIPFFAPLFTPGTRWDVYGPRGLDRTLGQTLAGQMQYAYFPVAVEQLAAEVDFHDLVEGSFEVEDVVVTAQYLHHPALTLGYRLEADGAVLVYACDHEPFDPDLAAGGDLTISPQDTRHLQLLEGADLVVHDAQYLPEEYAAKRGWGHSTYRYAVDAARQAGAAAVALTHHDPLRDDVALDRLLVDAAAYAGESGWAGHVRVAAEGDVVDLRPRSAARAARAASPRALAAPAAERLCTAVAVATEDPALRRAVGEAAEAEGLPVVTGGDLSRAVVVADADTGALERLRDLGVAAVLGLTRGRPLVDPRVTDWLVWPASLGHLRTKLRCAVLRQACRWQAAPLPADEESRLAALHGLGLLDSAPEERFDRLVRRACEELHVPLAMVTLVDAERQWFKARVGVDHTESHRDLSMCAHAMLEPDLLHVPDVALDDRFADNPATEGVRAYAGVPLVLSDGHRVGTLCVADRVPRALDHAELALLREVAHEVERELERASVTR